MKKLTSLFLVVLFLLSMFPLPSLGEYDLFMGSVEDYLMLFWNYCEHWNSLYGEELGDVSFNMDNTSVLLEKEIDGNLITVTDYDGIIIESDSSSIIRSARVNLTPPDDLVNKYYIRVAALVASTAFKSYPISDTEMEQRFTDALDSVSQGLDLYQDRNIGEAYGFDIKTSWGTFPFDLLVPDENTLYLSCGPALFWHENSSHFQAQAASVLSLEDITSSITRSVKNRLFNSDVEFYKVTFDDLSVSPYDSTDVFDKVSVKIYLTWDVNNGEDRTKRMLEMYSGDLSAMLAEEYTDSDFFIAEVWFFWQDKYITKTGYAAKYKHENILNKMYSAEKLGPLYGLN